MQYATTPKGQKLHQTRGIESIIPFCEKCGICNSESDSPEEGECQVIIHVRLLRGAQQPYRGRMPRILRKNENCEDKAAEIHMAMMVSVLVTI